MKRQRKDHSRKNDSDERRNLQQLKLGGWGIGSGSLGVMGSCFLCSEPALLSADGIYVQIQQISVMNQESDHQLGLSSVLK